MVTSGWPWITKMRQAKRPVPRSCRWDWRSRGQACTSFAGLMWAFISALDKDSTATAYPTRIGLLLDTLADKGKSPEKNGNRTRRWD